MARINQQEIALALNISQATVSRALANHPAINADTKAKIWALAAQNSYQTPPARTRGRKASKEPLVVGVLIAIPKRERSHAETSQLVLRGIGESSSSDVVTLDVVYQEPSSHNARQIQRRVRQNKWKGCILIHPMAQDIVELLSKTVSCVSVVENYRMDFIDCVDVDQIEAIGSLVRRLHAAGHDKIGYLSWMYDIPTPWVFHRFGAYVETLFQLGLPFMDERVINLNPRHPLSAEQAADEALAHIQRGTTAFVCAADHQAYTLRKLLQVRGIRVPEDCSITGFDGIEPAPGAPQIATVRVPYDEIGRSAFHQLMRRIHQPSTPRRHVLVDGEPIEGESIGQGPRQLNLKPKPQKIPLPG